MFTLYLFALLVGGGLLVFSLFGGGDDVGDDVGGDAGQNPVQWLSLRALMYFLFVFGGVGAVLSKTWSAAAAPLVAIVSVVGGLTVGAVVNATFAYLRRSDSGFRGGDDSFSGLAGRITLPFGESGTGKVLITRGDRTYEMLARPFGDTPTNPREWREVVVIEVTRGVALVSPLDSGNAELPPLDTP